MNGPPPLRALAARSRHPTHHPDGKAALHREKEAQAALAAAQAASPRREEPRGNAGIHAPPRDSYGNADDRLSVKQRNAIHEEHLTPNL